MSRVNFKYLLIAFVNRYYNITAVRGLKGKHIIIIAFLCWHKTEIKSNRADRNIL